MPYTPAESAWNTAGPANNFGAYPQPLTYSFEEAYSGSNFSVDFAKAKRQWAEIMGMAAPPWEGDDLLDETLQSYSLCHV